MEILFTDKIKAAISFAIQTHEVDQQQKRKGKQIPYVTHPLVVGMILARAGASENVVVAGILHDTIEDSIAAKKVSREMIAEFFGELVAELVMSVTEADKRLSWEERKREAIEHIKTFSHDSLLVKSGDVISNTSDIVEDFARNGAAIFERFAASKERTVEHYLQVIAAILAAWPEIPLTGDLEALARKLEAIRQTF